MNDRFKFRVWDKERNSYISPGGDEVFMLSLGGELVCWDLLSDKHRTASKMRFVIEYCTGFKDSGGELIYEGDILDATENGIDNKLIVHWHGEAFGGFTLENTRRGGVSLNTLIAAPMMNVVGNIHENPELLGQEKYTTNAPKTRITRNSRKRQNRT